MKTIILNQRKEISFPFPNKIPEAALCMKVENITFFDKNIENIRLHSNLFLYFCKKIEYGRKDSFHQQV